MGVICSITTFSPSLYRTITGLQSDIWAALPQQHVYPCECLPLTCAQVSVPLNSDHAVLSCCSAQPSPRRAGPPPLFCVWSSSLSSIHCVLLFPSVTRSLTGHCIIATIVIVLGLLAKPLRHRPLIHSRIILFRNKHMFVCFRWSLMWTDTSPRVVSPPLTHVYSRLCTRATCAT
jgi:hypothetical protein